MKSLYAAGLRFLKRNIIREKMSQKGDYIRMRCPKCNNVVYSHHQKINKSGTEIKRNYACRKCKYVFETVEQIIKTDKEE